MTPDDIFTTVVGMTDINKRFVIFNPFNYVALELSTRKMNVC